MSQQHVDGYREELTKLLDAKDPRAVGGDLLRGSVLFVLTGSAGEAPGRITIQIDQTMVRVLPGACSLEGRPVVLIQAPLAAWLAYSSSPSAEAREGISLYGEIRLLESLNSVVRAKRSAVSTRFFDLAPVVTNSKSRSKRKKQRHVHQAHH